MTKIDGVRCVLFNVRERFSTIPGRNGRLMANDDRFETKTYLLALVFDDGR